MRSVVALAGAAVVATAGAAGPALAEPSQGTATANLQALAPSGLFTWGDEIAGDLGNGVDGGAPLYGTPVMQADSPVSIPLPAGVRQLVAYDYDGAALLSNGTVATTPGASWATALRRITCVPSRFQA